MTQDQIIAYVDGELGPLEALRLERAMEADPAIAAQVERHRNLREAVAGHFAPVAEEPLPERLSGLLHGENNVVAFPQPRRTESRSGQGGRYAALAAMLVAGLMVGQLLPRTASGPIGQQGEVVMAQGELADALDSQLASAPQASPYRIGVSFRSTDNRYCRTFSAAAGAGIGCHDERGWALERFVAGGPAGRAGAYAQAASPSAEISAAAQDMMAGAPLDSRQEKEAKARGWRTKRG